MNNISKLELTFVIILLFVTLVLRLPQLGYSHFYGDETKTLYWNKSVPANEFFLDQRKGPVQFAVVWVVETITDGFKEGLVRLPFALAGIASVGIFYLLVRQLFDYKTAFLSSIIFTLNGFFIAFSRTAQYQSFLVFFGLTALLFALNKRWFLSSVSLAMAFLSHYDAVFFLVPVIFLLIRDAKTLRNWLIFTIPLLLLVGAFYLPYFTRGYAQANTFGYLNKRVEGKEYLPNNSLYTSKVYNPGFIAFIPLLFALFGMVGAVSWKKILLLMWFVVPFLVFEFVFSNPGTHIYNYLVPLIILATLGIFEVASYFRQTTFAFISVILLIQFFVMLFIFVPYFKLNYPWSSNKLGLALPDRRYNLFLYGFPYNRGWDQIKLYFSSKSGVRNFYTNDNPAIASYYLKEYDMTPPGSNYLPQYYIDVVKNQEFRDPITNVDSDYFLEDQIFVENVLAARIYKRLR